MLSNKYKRFIGINLVKRRFCSLPPKLSFDIEKEVKEINKKLDSIQVKIQPERFLNSNDLFWILFFVSLFGYWAYGEYTSSKVEIETAKYKQNYL
jgi:hypothetical protein